MLGLDRVLGLVDWFGLVWLDGGGGKWGLLVGCRREGWGGGGGWGGRGNIISSGVVWFVESLWCNLHRASLEWIMGYWGLPCFINDGSFALFVFSFDILFCSLTAAHICPLRLQTLFTNLERGIGESVGPMAWCVYMILVYKSTVPQGR